VKSGAGVIWLKNVFSGKDDVDDFCQKVRLTSYPENQTRNAPIELSTFWYITLGPTRYRKNTGRRNVISVNSGIVTLNQLFECNQRNQSDLSLKKFIKHTATLQLKYKYIKELKLSILFLILQFNI